MDIQQKTETIPTLNDVWAKYLPWAKEHKKTWDDDLFNYQKHLEPRFGKKQLDVIAPMDIERMKLDLKKALNKNGKPYSRATIKHQVVLLKRLYNLARRWGIYNGKNPLDQVEIPRLDNNRTEFMAQEEVIRLLQVLEKWPCQSMMSS